MELLWGLVVLGTFLVGVGGIVVGIAFVGSVVFYWLEEIRVYGVRELMPCLLGTGAILLGGVAAAVGFGLLFLVVLGIGVAQILGA